MSSKKSIIDSALADITTQFASRFHETLRPLRMIGKEAEFPVVTQDGRAADVGVLLRAFLDEGGFTPHYDEATLVSVAREGLEIAIEVGRGTIELALSPCADLWELEKEFGKAMALVTRVVESCGMHLLGFGIQPRTPASHALMTSRKHYHALYRAIGKPWLALTTTAADQTHVDICRTELLDAINWMNLLSAPLIALCANSSVYGGRAGKFVAGREGLLRSLGEDRYGMTPRKFSSLDEFIRYLCDYRSFILRDGDKYKQFNKPFTNHLTASAQPPNAFSDFLFHEHYIWNSARARVAVSTIEVRPACQQPPSEPFAANALILGWVEALPQVVAYFDDTLGNKTWDVMRVYRRAVVRDGLRTREPIPGMIRVLVEIAEDGLVRRGHGEEKFLLPVWKRIERRESPGMHARKLFEREGMQGLLKEIKIKTWKV